MYFRSGIELSLEHHGVAFPVSPAGKFFADCVASRLKKEDMTGRVLDIGTGTGVLALLLKLLGCRHVTATDISGGILDIARRNIDATVNAEWWCKSADAEWSPHISLVEADMFDGLSPIRDAQGPWDLIVFNAPGWRSPSTREAEDKLRSTFGDNYTLRFGGERLLKKFVRDLPLFLSDGGRALITASSIVGINNVLRYLFDLGGSWSVRSVANKSFEINWSSDMWGNHRDVIIAEMSTWRGLGRSYFEVRESGLNFDFEVLEISRFGTSS